MTDKHFKDWFNEKFPFGYGTGELYTLPALIGFFKTLKENLYNYEDLEKALTPTVAWLMIGILNEAGIFEYGMSSRFAWLEPKGEILAEYLKDKTLDQLNAAIDFQEDYIHCYPTHCNCGEVKCNNPLFNGE